jgi:hypothetical protein
MSTIFPPVYKTVPVQVLYHVTSTRCVSLSVSDKTWQPCVGPFRVDRFHIYRRDPRQNKYIQVMVSLEIYTEVELILRFRPKKKPKAFYWFSCRLYLRGFSISDLVRLLDQYISLFLMTHLYYLWSEFYFEWQTGCYICLDEKPFSIFLQIFYRVLVRNDVHR